MTLPQPEPPETKAPGAGIRGKDIAPPMSASSGWATRHPSTSHERMPANPLISGNNATDAAKRSAAARRRGLPPAVRMTVRVARTQVPL